MRVKFLLEKGSKTEVFALFVDMEERPIHTTNGSTINCYTCYAHIGQHSKCNADYASKCKEAGKEQYTDLLKELESIGYTDIEILNKN